MDSYSAAAHRNGGSRRAGDDEEIGVFTAERYFSGGDVDSLWCGRSSSSFSSAFKTGGQQDWSAGPTTLTAATSSSEASWNSRSVLLPDPPMAITVESEEEPPGAGDRTPGSKASSSSSSHNLLRWLLGVAGCACAAAGGVEEAVSTDERRRDEAHAIGFVLGEETRSTDEADAMLPGSKSIPTAAEDVTTTRVRPGMSAGGDGVAFDTGTAAPPPLQLGEPCRVRADDSGELLERMLNPRTAVLADEWRRRSLDMLASATAGQQNSAFTIVAGRTAPRDDAADAGAADGGTGSHDRLDSGADDAATGELDCMYPPSEASVVWSVVTADGAASGNFSSAASGYYRHYYYHNGGGGNERHTASGKSNRRSGGGGARANGGGLLTSCMSERAVDAIGPLRPAAEARAARHEGDPKWHAAGRH